MHIRLALLLLLGLGACLPSQADKDDDDERQGDDDDDGDDDGDGSIDVDAIGAFDEVRSAVWVHTGIGGNGLEAILLTNVSDYCEKARSMWDAVDDYEDARDDIDDEDYCEEAREPTMEYVAAVEALYSEGAFYLSVGLPPDEELEEDDYDLDDEDAFGRVYAYLINPADRYEDWDENGDKDDDCGMDAVDEDSYDEWSFDYGGLVVDALEPRETAEGNISGGLLDDDEDEDGEVEADFVAAWCELDLD